MSRRSTLILVGAALAVAGPTVFAAPAQAAVPLDPPAAQQFAVACSTGQRAQVTLPVDGSFALGSVVHSSDVLVPYRFDYRWADRHGNVLIRSEAQGETGPVPASATTCRLAPIAYPDGTAFSFTVTTVIRRAR